MDLVYAVYGAVRSFPKSEMFGLSAQMRSAASSIPSNIAEGKGRSTDRDYRYFGVRARASGFELETQIEIARRQRFLDDATAASLTAESERVGRRLNRLISYLDRCLKSPDA